MMHPTFSLEKPSSACDAAIKKALNSNTRQKGLEDFRNWATTCTSIKEIEVNKACEVLVKPSTRNNPLGNSTIGALATCFGRNKVDERWPNKMKYVHKVFDENLREKWTTMRDIQALSLDYHGAVGSTCMISSNACGDVVTHRHTHVLLHLIVC